MAYQSCRYAPPPAMAGDMQMIICTDDEGQEWWIPPDSQDGAYLRFIEAGGTVDPYEPPPAPEEPTNG